MSDDAFWVGPPTAPDTYRLVSQLGSGGEGAVWKAVVPLSGQGRQVVAIKIVRSLGDADEERWNSHALLLRSLAHPGLVRVIDTFAGAGWHRRGEEGGGAWRYVVMSRVDGLTLSDWVAENPGAPAPKRLQMLRMVADALDYMHSGLDTEVPVAHGDVKPANIVVDRDDRAVLVDLGLVRIADGQGTVGRSAPYAAPEHRGSGPVATPDADRYAFAVTVAETLLGGPAPLDAAGWLDLDELRSALASGELTRRRHALNRHVLSALDSPPEARPRELGRWLVGAAQNVSQVTGPGGLDDPALVPPAAVLREAAPVPPEPALQVGGAPTFAPAAAHAARADDGPASKRDSDRGTVTTGASEAFMLAPPLVDAPTVVTADAVQPDPRPRRMRLTRGWLWAGLGLVTALLIGTSAVVTLRGGIGLADAGRAESAAADPTIAAPTTTVPAEPAGTAAPAAGPAAAPGVPSVPRPGMLPGRGGTTTSPVGGITAPVAALRVTTRSLPATAVRTPMSATLAAEGGVPPYRWRISAGDLPDGLTLSPDGKIGGTPTSPTTAHFTVTVTDSAGTAAAKDFSLSPTAVVGDINRDGPVDCADKAILDEQWGHTGPGLSADLNKDQVVNVQDLSILLSHWGGGSSQECA